MKPYRGRFLLRDYIETLTVALLVAVFIRLFVLTAYKIPTTSMLPTLRSGDFIFAYKIPYGVRLPLSTQKIIPGGKPIRGEVVVFRYPRDEGLHFVKRVVAVEGDKIEIRNRRLYVNDVPSRYDRLEGEAPQIPGVEYYVVLRETLGDSTRLVMLRKGGKANQFGPEVIPPGSVFVLGDNRDSSDDSRYWGVVPIDYIEGKVIGVWLSLDWEEKWGFASLPKIRWERVLRSIE